MVISIQLVAGTVLSFPGGTAAYPGGGVALHAQPDHEPHDFDYFDGYVRALGLVALGILLETEDSTFARLLREINQSGRDALFDRLVALRQDNASSMTVLMYPRPYRPLYAALDASATVRPTLLADFVQQYYPAMKGVYWHNTHRRDDVGFFGYWCFELAAFVHELEWDDEACLPSPYYPRAWRADRGTL